MTLFAKIFGYLPETLQMVLTALFMGVVMYGIKCVTGLGA